MKKIVLSLFAVAACLLVGNCAALAAGAKLVTISGHGTMLPGGTNVVVNLPLPQCGKGEFLVQSVEVGPEIVSGTTANDIVNINKWGVSVPLYQISTTATNLVPLTALTSGAKNVSAALPAGQSTLPGSTSLAVTILLLNGDIASDQFEFNVHVTGTCGTPFVAP